MDEKKKKQQTKPVLKNKKMVSKVLSEKEKPSSKKTPVKKKIVKNTKKKPVKKVQPKVVKDIEEKVVETREIEKVTKKTTPKKTVSKVETKQKKSADTIKKTKVVKEKPKESVKPKKEEPKEKLKEKELDDKDFTRKIKLKIKDKLFEEHEEKPVEEISEEAKKRKNNIYFFVVIAILLVASVVVAYSYNNDMDKIQKKYFELTYGEKVKLRDDSSWYVVEESGTNKSKVKLLAEKRIDINSDGNFDNNDKIKYNSFGKDTYDNHDEGGVAYFLNSTYKKELANRNINNIKEVRLLTSKEFVKLRGKMGYAYEWNDGNWLASDSLSSWWIESSQNSKVYVVSPKGSYKLVEPNSNYYIRPLIIIEKSEIIKKVVDKD